MNNRTDPRNDQSNTNTKKNRYNDEPPSSDNDKANSNVYHDQISNVVFHGRMPRRKTIPPPISSNMQLINSPAPSPRRLRSSDGSDDEYVEVNNNKKKKRIQKQTGHLHPDQTYPILDFNLNNNCNTTTAPHSSVPTHKVTSPAQPVHHLANPLHHHQERPQITRESTRYAQTRYPFPPFVIRFNSSNVTTKQVSEDLIEHVKLKYQKTIQLANCRTSNIARVNNEHDLLIYIKDSDSFCFLLDQSTWPTKLCNLVYTFPTSPSIQPQLSLIIKNVDLRIDLEDFIDDIKASYSHVKNVIRMKNKFQNNIKLVKIELTSPSLKEQLLNSKKIIVNHITYDIDEYLAPATVLICSRCMAIGHFKSQCKQINETCKTCGEQCVDLKLHNCSQVEKCIHCQQNHKSNALKCPVVKSYRAELTKKILDINSGSLPKPMPKNNIFKYNYTYDASNFPPLPHAQSNFNSNNPMMIKLDDLIEKMTEVKEHLATLAINNEKFEQFIQDKNQHDDLTKQQIDSLLNNDNAIKKDLVQHSLLIERHENMFIKLLIPMFEDLFTLIAGQNQDKRGENRNGGVFVLVKNGIHVNRVDCKLPNVCVIDINAEDELRILGIYASDSRSWSWDNISPLISNRCVVYGDFNVDLEHDTNKAEILLNWADENSLAPYTPNLPTSLRSNRIIDYAFARGMNIDIQTHASNTTSDHFPILSVISTNIKQNVLGANVRWKVFALFSEYAYAFWEKRWNVRNIDGTYDEYIKFLSLPTARCTITFPLDRYRVALPTELRSFMSYVRALSFRALRTKSSELKMEVCCLRKIAKTELKSFLSRQLSIALRLRNTSSPISVSFWARTKRFLKPSSSTLHAFVDSSEQIIREPGKMCELAAEFYEDFFKKNEVVRPHPYTDTPLIEFDNEDENIPEVTLNELIETIHAKRKKKSLDAHGISNFMFNFLAPSNWSLLLQLYNQSFQKATLPVAWKDTPVQPINFAKTEALYSARAIGSPKFNIFFDEMKEK
ncbi:unnamed protein product [Rotaria socialis]|uniref:Endonuclease/exonuclease/phosphatase domain-containing protein n=5 Tax=Rotaria TaxID=231623 RepID=A0A820WCQ7_9BILA|nr:unnamed protein product [Rotaria socialis]